MSTIETIVRPCRNRISISVPSEYNSCSFHVILIPLQENREQSLPPQNRNRSFVEALMACPKLDEGETLDISRDPTDFGREVAL